jgi:CRP-like cAMP-binding protein
MFFLKRFFSQDPLPDAVTSALQALSSLVSFTAHDIVFDQHEAVDAFFLIKQGAVLLRHNGNELKMVGPGELIGEDAVFNQLPGYEFAAITTEATQLIRIPAKAFMDLVDAHPTLACKLLKAVSTQLFDPEVVVERDRQHNAANRIETPLDFIPVLDMPFTGGFQFFLPPNEG